MKYTCRLIYTVEPHCNGPTVGVAWENLAKVEILIEYYSRDREITALKSQQKYEHVSNRNNQHIHGWMAGWQDGWMGGHPFRGRN